MAQDTLKNQIFTFDPIYQYRLWGGEKLRKQLGKNAPEGLIGESWEISAVKGNETKVIRGPYKGQTIPELIEVYQEDFLGRSIYKKYGVEFPMLIKFIDAHLPLSIQVHPSDEVARERHNSFGKNEMWYIMDSDHDAEIIVGFNKQIDAVTLAQKSHEGTLEEVMNKIRVKAGDLFYLPTGRVHAIGAGVMLAEIQQSSDITYRIYDFNRIDPATGNRRELHIDESMDVVEFKLYDTYKTQYDTSEGSHLMINTDYFTTHIHRNVSKEKLSIIERDSFTIFICTRGTALLKTTEDELHLKIGECAMISASCEEYSLEVNGEMLETFINIK